MCLKCAFPNTFWVGGGSYCDACHCSNERTRLTFSSSVLLFTSSSPNVLASEYGTHLSTGSRARGMDASPRVEAEWTFWLKCVFRIMAQPKPSMERLCLQRNTEDQFWIQNTCMLHSALSFILLSHRGFSHLQCDGRLETVGVVVALM